MIEQEIVVGTPDGQADAYIYKPAAAGRWPGAVVFTDGVGIRQAFRDLAARLADGGYVVLLPNPFYRDGRIRDRDHPDETKAGSDASVSRSGELAMNIAKGGGLPRDLNAYLNFLAGHESVKPGKLGCTGYCMGGNFALAAAGLSPQHVGAAASFHGGALATDSLDSPHRLAHAMRGEIYVGVAEIDPYLQPGETDRLRGALEGAAVSHRMEMYEGARHGFTVPTNPQYDETAAERHWKALFELFDSAL